jgi:hypothetical protein
MDTEKIGLKEEPPAHGGDLREALEVRQKHVSLHRTQHKSAECKKTLAKR